MKKVTIYDWARSGLSEGLLLAEGLEHDQQLELDEDRIKELVLKLFLAGLNVMLRHTKGNSILLCVDTGIFTQH